MNERRGFRGWQRLAEYLLEPRDVERIIVPTIADAHFERTLEKSKLRWLLRSQFQLACALCGAVTSMAGQQLRDAPWFAVLALLLAGLGGAAAMQQGPVPEIARNQLLFMLLGAIVTIIIVTLPAKLLRAAGTATILLGLSGLIACPWFGEVHNGERQWLKFGSLQIHVATLALPGFVAFVRRATAAREIAYLATGTLVSLALLLLQQNLEAALVYTLTVGAAIMHGRSNWLSVAMALALVVAVGTATLAAGSDSVWSLLGLMALALAIGWSLIPRVAHVKRRLSTQTLTMAMVSLTLLRSLESDTLPVVGFGGSAVVAFFVLVALQMREVQGAIVASER